MNKIIKMVKKNIITKNTPMVKQGEVLVDGIEKAAEMFKEDDDTNTKQPKK